jgi:hypothetical protein
MKSFSLWRTAGPFVFFSAIAASAQIMAPTAITDNSRIGDLPFSSSIGTTVEHVDLASGTLNLAIPLFSTPGRGFSTGVTLYYSSNMFNVNTLFDSEGNVDVREWAVEAGAGWVDNSPTYSTSTISVKCHIQPTNGGGYYASYTVGPIYTDAEHQQHQLTSQSASGSSYCTNPSDAGPDGGAVGMWSADPYHIVDASGASIVSYTNVKTDTNGNSVTLPGASFFGNSTDTLGRKAYTVSSTTNSDGSLNTTTYTINGSSGTAQTYTLHWTETPLNTNFNIGAEEINSTTYSPAPSTSGISEIDLPNGQKYTFRYEPNYGLLNSITLPDGGTIQYVYSNYTDTSDLYNTGTRRYVSARTETHDGSSAKWQINIPNNQGNNVSTKTATVTFPDASAHQAVITAHDGAVTDMKVFAGTASGNPLREYIVTYATDANPFIDSCWSQYGHGSLPQHQSFGVRPTKITTVLDNGLSSVKQYTYDSFSYTYHPSHCNTVQAAQTLTTSRGDVLEEDDYDWAQSGTLGALLRKITHTYLHTTASNASAYVSANIVDKITLTSIYDASNTLLSQTKYSYADYLGADGSGLTATVNVPSHDYTAYSSSTVLRGNITQVGRWLSPGSANWLTTSYSYDDLGNILG